MVPESIKMPVPAAIVRLVADPAIGQDMVAVDPAATVIELAAGRVNEFVPTIEAPLPMEVINAQEPATFIVTVIPALIVMSSLFVGKAAPPQVAVAFQFPLTLATRAAPSANFVPPNKIKTHHTHRILLYGMKNFMDCKAHT